MPELTLRDGMVIVGSLLILAVIVDAWRRMRQQQRDRVRMKLATDVPADDLLDDISQFRELPNGGARVVNRDGLSDDASADATGIAAAESAAKQKSAPQEPRKPAASKSPDPAEAAPAASATAPVRSSGERKPQAAPKPPEPESEPEVEVVATNEADEDALLAGMRARDDEPATLDWLEDLPHPDAGEDDEPGELPRESDTEVLILHVMARDEAGFSGKDILEILLACDLRFGDMNFFHRHEEQAGRGPIQFSVANMLQPGVFDIDNMESMRTRGLVFFVTLPGPRDMSQAYDYMLETARTVARNLGGELLDESRSVLTQQAVEHSRQQIRELERRLRVQSA